MNTNEPSAVQAKKQTAHTCLTAHMYATVPIPSSTPDALKCHIKFSPIKNTLQCDFSSKFFDHLFFVSLVVNMRAIDCMESLVTERGTLIVSLSHSCKLIGSENVVNCRFAGNACAENAEPQDDPRIHDENAQSKQLRRDYINSKLGTGMQPVLETVKYQVSNFDVLHTDNSHTIMHTAVNCVQ